MASIKKDSSRNCDIKYVHGMSIYVTDNRGMKTAQLYALRYDDNSRLFTIEIEDNTRKTIIFNKYNIKNLGSWLVRPSIELFLQNELHRNSYLNPHPEVPHQQFVALDLFEVIFQLLLSHL